MRKSLAVTAKTLLICLSSKRDNTRSSLLPISSKLKLLVNDQEAGDLSGGKLSLAVKPGDRLAVDARSAAGGVKLRVSGVSRELTYPKLNQIWPLRGGVVDLGEVKAQP